MYRRDEHFRYNLNRICKRCYGELQENVKNTSNTSTMNEKKNNDQRYYKSRNKLTAV